METGELLTRIQALQAQLQAALDDEDVDRQYVLEDLERELSALEEELRASA